MLFQPFKKGTQVRLLFIKGEAKEINLQTIAIATLSRNCRNSDGRSQTVTIAMIFPKLSQ